MGRILALCLAAIIWAAPLRAEPVLLPDLVAVMRLPDMIDVMRAEGLAQGENLGAEMIPGRDDAAWLALLDRLYDPDRMLDVVQAEMDAGLRDVDLAPLVAFFATDTGQRIVTGELTARRAFLDPDVEMAARAALAAPADDDARDRAIAAFIAANDLVEMNVSGGLTASLRFYQGLAQGGQLDMTEAEMLDDIWSREEETRTDAAEWLRALLSVAYHDVPAAGVTDYVDLSLTPAGQALNAALFAGFDRMYGDLHYALGLALASRMAGEDL